MSEKNVFLQNEPSPENGQSLVEKKMRYYRSNPIPKADTRARLAKQTGPCHSVLLSFSPSAIQPFRPSPPYFGCGTIRRYGFGAFHPPGYFCFASSSVTDGRMITSSPSFQFTGVATLCLAVSCIESSTRSTSSKLRPVLIG